MFIVGVTYTGRRRADFNEFLAQLSKRKASCPPSSCSWELIVIGDLNIPFELINPLSPCLCACLSHDLHNIT